MKKEKNILRVALVIVAVLSIALVSLKSAYASKNTTTAKSFFYANETELEAGEYAVFTIDLSDVEGDFTLTLTGSGIDLQDLLIGATSKENLQLTEDSIDVSSGSDNNSAMVISGSSETLNSTSITLYYQIPEDAEASEQYKLTATLVTEEASEDENSTEKTTTTTQTETVTIVVIKKEEKAKENTTEDNTTEENKTEDNKTSEEDKSKDDDNKPDDSKKDEQSTTEESKENSSTENAPAFSESLSSLVGQNTEKQSQASTEFSQTQATQSMSTSQMSEMTSTSGMASASAGTTTKTVTYNGSYNNYLKSLSINGAELTPEFDKTTDTYFVEVENSVEKVTVKYEAEDDGAKVKVYGDTDLEIGENKVLISVTADNRSVRTYKIFVTRKAE